MYEGGDSTKTNQDKSSNTLTTPTIEGGNSTNRILSGQSMQLNGENNLDIKDKKEDWIIIDKPPTHNIPSNPNEINEFKKTYNSLQQNDNKSFNVSSIMDGSDPNAYSILNVNQFESPVHFKNNSGHLARITNTEAQNYLKNSTHKKQKNDEGFFDACRRPLRIGNKKYDTLKNDILSSPKWYNDNNANAVKASAEEKIELARSFLVKELIINTFKKDNDDEPLTLIELEKFNKENSETIDKIVNNEANNDEINELYNKLDGRKIPSRSNFIRLIKDCDAYAKSYSQGEAKALSAIVENSLDKLNCCTNKCELVLGIENNGLARNNYNITMTNTMQDMVLQTDGISSKHNDDWDGGKKIDIPGSKIAIKSAIKNGSIERQGIIAYDSFTCDIVAGKNKFSSNSLTPYIQDNSDQYVSTSDPKYFRKSAFSRVFTTFDGLKGGIAGMVLAGMATGGLAYFGIIGTAISAIAFPPLAVAIVGGIIIAAASFFLGKWLLPKPIAWLGEKIKCYIPCWGKSDDIDGKTHSIEENDKLLHNDQHSTPKTINHEQKGFNKPTVKDNDSLTGTNGFHQQNETNNKTIIDDSIPKENRTTHSNSIGSQT